MSLRKLWLGLTCCVPLVAACTDRGVEPLPVAEAAQEPPVAESPPAKFNPRLLRRFKPLRDTLGDAPSDAQVELGRMLYHETRMSKAQDLSCNSCHPLNRYGADGEVTSLGFKEQRGTRNAPTTYNAAAAFRQFWDGRAGTVEEQATGPILNPIEMAAPGAAHVERVLDSMPEYVGAFARAFPGERDPVTLANVGKALGAFERRLVTPSRWDDYLRGEQAALTDKEVEGLKIFTNVGCMVCHTGELVGGSMFQKVGAVEPWPNLRDQGRFEVTRDPGDKMMFKVPTLRNVAMTAPYFHDGSATTLEDAVRKMGKHQLGLELSAKEVEAITAWLRALTGKLPAKYTAAPALPSSGPATPKAG
jgi:cytochrome c peroxidase